jgi:hypothetical protein
VILERFHSASLPVRKLGASQRNGVITRLGQPFRLSRTQSSGESGQGLTAIRIFAQARRSLAAEQRR